MMQVVNGYVCFSSCEVATAKQGKDPHAPMGALPDYGKHESGLNGQPATILDGALKKEADALDPPGANGASHSAGSGMSDGSSDATSQGIDRLV